MMKWPLTWRTILRKVRSSLHSKILNRPCPISSEPANARASAREKLTRLTRQQFQELSTDVYDELLRRKNNTENDGLSPTDISNRQS